MRILFKLFKVLAIGFYLVVGVLLVLFLVPQTGYKAYVVQTGSMAPAISQGSLVIDHHVNPRTIKAGEVITYINPQNTRQTITHRVVKSEARPGLTALVTKGDANQAPDREILGGSVVGRVVLHIPYLGSATNWLHTLPGLFLLVLLPGLIIIIDEIRRMNRALTDPIRRDHGQNPGVEFYAAQPSVEVERSGAGNRTRSPGTRPRTFDGIKRISVLLILLGGFTGVTFSSLSASARLTNNSISTTPQTANHLLIEAVFAGAALPSGCGDISISESNQNTGSDSTNTNNVSIHCESSSSTSSTSNTSNNVSVGSSTGGNSSSNNTSGGSVTSGSTSTSITINNSSGTSANPAHSAIELYNPTASAVDLSGWSLIGTAGPTTSLSGTLSSHGLLIVNLGSVLTPAGDHLSLKHGVSAIDALSWGSDTSILSPSAPAITPNHYLQRINLGVDTNTAADWHLADL